MRNFLFAIAVLLLAGSGAAEIFFDGQASGHGKTTKSDTKTLRIAVVQMKSLDHDIDGNLKQATFYAEKAAGAGAQFVLFPELMATGSYLSFDTWDSAEPSQGKTVLWLKSTSRRLHIYMGVSFFEASGEDFYDTCALNVSGNHSI